MLGILITHTHKESGRKRGEAMDAGAVVTGSWVCTCLPAPQAVHMEHGQFRGVSHTSVRWLRDARACSS